MPLVTEQQAKNVKELLSDWSDQAVNEQYLPVMLVTLAANGDIKIYSVVNDQAAAYQVLSEAARKIGLGDYKKTTGTKKF